MTHRRKLMLWENKGKKCSVEGCNYNARVKGMCINCYAKTKKYPRYKSSG